MNQHLSTLHTLVYCFLLSIIGYTLYYLSLNTFYADSEIWLLTISQNLLTPSKAASILYKLSFHALTFLSTIWVNGELQIYHAARLFWLTTVVVSILVFCYQMQKNSPKHKQWLIALALACTTSLFLGQSFRIRGDVLLLSCHLLALANMLYQYRKKHTDTHPFLQSLLILLLILSTPKFIYFWVAQFVFGYILFKDNKNGRRWHLISHILPASLLLFAFLIVSSSLFGIYHPLHAISWALDFFIKTNDSQLGNPGYLSAASFLYIKTFIARNPIHALLVYLTAFLALLRLLKIKEFQKKSQIYQSSAVYCLLFFLISLFHNDKLPFFLCTTLTPILLICPYLIFEDIQKHQSRLQALFFTAIIGSCFTAYYFCLQSFAENNNKSQEVAISNLETYANTYPELRLYDIIGVLPHRNEFFIFVGPSESARKQEIIQRISLAKPNFILGTFKLNFLMPEAKKYLEKNFVNIAIGQWSLGERVQPVSHPHLFKKQITIKNKKYWVWPQVKYKYVYEATSLEDLNEKIIHLDSTLSPTTSISKFMAVPADYINLSTSQFPRIDLPARPDYLFRYNTSF